MRPIEADGTVKDGQLLVDHGAWFRNLLRQRLNGQRVRVLVLPAGDEQQSPFRRWYWRVVVEAFRAHMVEQGEGEATARRAHDVLAGMFLDLGNGQRRSTSPDSMSDREFKHYVLDQVLPFLVRDCGLEIEEQPR